MLVLNIPHNHSCVKSLFVWSQAVCAWCVCVCVCMCVRERERGRERVCVWCVTTLPWQNFAKRKAVLQWFMTSHDETNFAMTNFCRYGKTCSTFTVAAAKANLSFSKHEKTVMF